MKGSIVYISFIDIGKTNGPGVNEFEFLTALKKVADVKVFSPTPSTQNGDADFNALYFSKLTLKKPFNFILGNYRIYQNVSSYIKKNNITKVIFRPSRLMFAIIPLLLNSKVHVHARHFNGTKFGDTKNIKGFKKIASFVLAAIDLPIKNLILNKVNSLDVCTSEQLATIRKCIKRKDGILLIDNGVNTEKFFPINTERKDEILRKYTGLVGRKIIGFAGGFPSVRGGQHLIRLAASMKNEQLLFIVAGEDENIFKIYDDCGRPDNVLILGLVKYHEIHEIVQTFDIGVAFDDVSRVLDVGNANQKVRQYLAVGAQVITYEPTPLLSVNQRLAYSINPLADSFYKELGESISNITSSEQIKYNAKVYRNNYAIAHLSTNKMVDETIKVFNE